MQIFNFDFFKKHTNNSRVNFDDFHNFEWMQSIKTCVDPLFILPVGQSTTFIKKIMDMN